MCMTILIKLLITLYTNGDESNEKRCYIDVHIVGYETYIVSEVNSNNIQVVDSHTRLTVKDCLKNEDS
jgi:hypothetical protein